MGSVYIIIFSEERLFGLKYENCLIFLCFVIFSCTGPTTNFWFNPLYGWFESLTILSDMGENFSIQRLFYLTENYPAYEYI